MLYYKKISKNKAIELSTDSSWRNNYFTIDISFNKNQCHAGFHFLICIIRWKLELNIYDIRHWNYDDNCWEVYIETSDVPNVIKKSKSELDEHIGIGA